MLFIIGRVRLLAKSERTTARGEVSHVICQADSPISQGVSKIWSSLIGFCVHLVDQVYQLCQDGEALMQRLAVRGNTQRRHSGSLMGAQALTYHLFVPIRLVFSTRSSGMSAIAASRWRLSQRSCTCRAISAYPARR